MGKQELAMQVLQQVVKLPMVKVDREKFLVDKFSKELDRKDIATLLEKGPTSLLTKESLDRVAKTCIKDNVLRASGDFDFGGFTWWYCHGNHYSNRYSTVLRFLIKTSSRTRVYLRI